MSESKLIRKARSLGRRTLRRNSTQDSCSMVSTRSWLGLVSMSRPSVRGWSESAAKYLMVWGLPSAITSKSFLVRPGISRPCLSFTLKKMLTTLTCALKVVGGSSLSGCCDCCSCVWGGTDEVGGAWSCTVYWAAIKTAEDNSKATTKANWRTGVNNIHTLSFRMHLLYCTTLPRSIFRRAARFGMQVYLGLVPASWRSATQHGEASTEFLGPIRLVTGGRDHGRRRSGLSTAAAA